jgi:hypothetical protein
MELIFVLERHPESGYLGTTDVLQVDGVKLPERLDPASEYFRYLLSTFYILPFILTLSGRFTRLY